MSYRLLTLPTRHQFPAERLQQLLVVCIAVCCCLSLSGCQIFTRFRSEPLKVPVVLDKSASLDQLLAAVRSQSERVNQIKTDVRVTAPGSPTLRGDLQIERPDRLRLQAGVLGISDLGFDLGSNPDNFWVWKKAALPGDPPTLFFASHSGYQQSVLREHLQLQPLWLVDALGLIDFHPDDQHTGPFPREDGRVEIRSFSSSASRPAVRVAVIDPAKATVNQQSFYDRDGKLLAYLNSVQHQYYPEHQVSLPQRVEIYIAGPDGKTNKLTVDSGKYLINSLFGDPQLLWQMPNPPDVRKIDLSAAAPTPTVPEQAQAPVQRQARDWSAPRY
jgi:hypothetical protein